MAVFVMQPAFTFGDVSEQNLDQAETRLQDLANQLSRVKIDSNRSIEKLKQHLIDILHQDRAEQRNDSIRKYDNSTEIIQKLSTQITTLNEHLSQEKSVLLRSETPQSISIEEISEWQRKRVAKLEGLQYDNEHQLAQLSSELDSFTLQANHLHTELHTTLLESNELIAEDEKLYSPDRRTEIEKEIHLLQKKIGALAAKAAEICQIPYSAEFNFTEMIARFESDLKTIQLRVGEIGSNLDNPAIKPASKQISRSKKKQQPDEMEMEGIVDQIKALVKDKTIRIRQLKQLKLEVIKLSQLEKTARLDLKGEQSRMEKQNARTRSIKDLKTTQINLKQKLEQVQKKIADLGADKEKCLKNQENILRQIQFYQTQLEKVLAVATSIKDCETQLIKEKSKLSKLVPAAAIWHESIQYRIKKVRRNISFGNPLMLLLLPYRCYYRYQLGLKIRKDLVLTERSLQRLGLLSKEYVEQVDIFNRTNKKGQQLCLDILSC